MPLAECQHCGRTFEVAANFTGGLVPCPGCGKVAEVSGLRDPFWNVLRAVAVVATIGIGVYVGSEHGAPIGIAVAIVLLAMIWLISRVL